MKSFFAELQPWNVYKVAVAYAVLAWLLIQVVTQVFPFFGIPNCAVRIRIGWFCRPELQKLIARQR